MLERQQKSRQEGEGLLTLGAEKAMYLALLFLDSGSSGLTRAGAMPMNFAATQGTLAEGICSRCILWGLS